MRPESRYRNPAQQAAVNRQADFNNIPGKLLYNYTALSGAVVIVISINLN